MRNKLILLAYQWIASLAGIWGWPLFYRHLKSRGRGESFLPRLGLQLPAPPPPGRPRLWLHGVSVGEILAALPLVQELKNLLPQASLIISTGTETGQALARRHYESLGALVCYFPWDLPWAVQRYLLHLRPDAFIALESELWPGFLSAAHRRGVRLGLVNARLSDKSFRKYLKYRKYLIELIELFDMIAAGSALDYERLGRLGISPGKLHLTGNLKIDRLLQGLAPAKAEVGPPALSNLQKSWKAQLNLKNHPVFLAASTHPGEDEVVLDAYEELRPPYPTLLLLLAPRHPERAPALGRLLERRGLSFQLWSQLKSGQETRHYPIILIDTIGDLFSLYGIADVTFVGGSLVPHGGQNILEAAAWGLSPLYGPHLENFRWAQDILEAAGVGATVHDAASLAAAARRLLDHPDDRRRLGALAQAALTPHQGAARRQAELIVKMVGGGGQW